MPRYELSIDAAYLEGSWGAFQGVRELVQNARDAEIEFGAKMEITHYTGGNGQLRINNEGVTLGKEALLMGNTSKAARTDLIGKWGEGLKVGILALLRDGYEVKIRTGSEVWVPTIEHSEKFEAQVLVFQVSTGRKHQDRVRVEVSPFSKEDWDEWRPMFLFLDKEKEDERVKGYGGALLLNPKYKGWVFVKGIATERIPEQTYGYNLTSVELDRDRKMVDRWYLKYYISRIWDEAFRTRPDLLDPGFTLLQNESPEASAFADNLTIEAKEKVAGKFTETFGEKALPVSSVGDSVKLEHLGKKGIVVPTPMRQVLDSVFGTTEQNLAELKKEAQKLYSWHELDETEKASLQRAVDSVSHEEPRLSLDLIRITDFSDEATLGTYEKKEGQAVLIHLSKRILSDRALTLLTTIHEACHMVGGDGEHSHIDYIEQMWSSILERCLSMAAQD